MRVQGSGFRDQGSGTRVQGLGQSGTFVGPNASISSPSISVITSPTCGGSGFGFRVRVEDLGVGVQGEG